MAKVFKKKIDYVLILSFIFLPIILHLHEINLQQYEISSIGYLILSQLIISFVILILSIIFFFFYDKKNLLDFLICNFFFFFSLFYYKKINSIEIIQKTEKFHFLIDNLITLLLFIIFYLIIFQLLKKFNKLIKTFLIFFIFLNFSYGFYNMNFFKLVHSSDNIFVSNNMIDLGTIKKSSSDKISNVYLVILDGMISLNKAEKLKIISSEKEIIDKLKKNNYRYNSSFKSNYPVTYASVQSLLYGNFPVTENSKIYKNRLSFYPYIMRDKKNFFYQIVNRIDMNFFWVGNKWGPCTGLKNGECFYNYSEKNNFLTKLIFSSELFYIDSIFSYFFNYISKDIFITAYDFLRYSKNQKERFSSKNKGNFFFIHVYKPHKPYDLDQNCNNVGVRKSISKEKIVEYYKYNYNCALSTFINWEKKFIDNDQNNLVILLGDHGWSFVNKNLNQDEFIKERLNDVFFAYKVPEKCNSIKIPKSHVNVMRFLLNCLESSNLKYLKDEQYILRYEGHKDYGRAIRLMGNE